MALFTGTTRQGYAQAHNMPQPTLGDGPWGEAIEYWLKQRRWQQADIVRALEVLYPSTKGKKSKGNKNTVSTAARGLDCNTRSLRRIAKALAVPLDQVLVSPLRRAANEERRQLALDITERVLRAMESTGKPVARAETQQGTEGHHQPPSNPLYTKTMQAGVDEFNAEQEAKRKKKAQKKPKDKLKKEPPTHRRANNG